MRKAVVAAVAILLLGGAAIVVITLLPTGPSIPEPGATAPSPPSMPPPEGAPLVPMRPDGSIARIEPGPPTQYEPPPPKAPPGSWEAVSVTARASALGPAGAAVARELAELQPKLADCFDEVTQSRYGQAGFSRTQDNATPSETGTTVFLLQLEMTPGQVRIVDAPIDTQGSASDGLVACAQRVLRGRVIPVPEAQAGQRARLIFPLFQ